VHGVDVSHAGRGSEDADLMAPLGKRMDEALGKVGCAVYVRVVGISSSINISLSGM